MSWLEHASHLRQSGAARHHFMPRLPARHRQGTVFLIGGQNGAVGSANTSNTSALNDVWRRRRAQFPVHHSLLSLSLSFSPLVRDIRRIRVLRWCGDAGQRLLPHICVWHVLGRIWSKPSDFGRCLAKLCRIWLISVECRPILADSGPTLVDVGQIWAIQGQNSPILANFGETSVEIRPVLGDCGASSAELGPNLVDVGGKLGRNPTCVGRFWGRFGLNRAKFRRLRAIV